jgi:hypothetical protein
MANEKTLAKPLSGGEIIEAIVSKIRQQMQRDCFLAPHIAYASFSFQATVRVQFQNTGTAIKETMVTSTGLGGEVSNADMESAEVEVSDEPKPPNDVRVESGQGVPALVTKPTGGVEEKKIKYAPPNKPATTTKKALQQKA